MAKKISASYWEKLSDKEKEFFQKYANKSSITELKSIVSLSKKLFPNKEVGLFSNRFLVDGKEHYFSLETKRIVWVVDVNKA